MSVVVWGGVEAVLAGRLVPHSMAHTISLVSLTQMILDVCIQAATAQLFTNLPVSVCMHSVHIG